MKKIFTILFAAAALTGCNDAAPVYWEEIEIDRQGGGLTAEFNYPFRFGGIDSVTTLINATIEERLKEGVMYEYPDLTLDSALNLLIESKEADTVLVRIPYELMSDGAVYRTKGVESVMLDKYSYTGGANGMAERIYLNFDPATGRLLSDDELFSSADKLRRMIADRFSESVDEDYALFEGLSIDSLPLPRQIGFDSIGVVAYYNLYEIAPRSSGAVEIHIPYDETDGIVLRDVSEVR
ncbi:MAG: DUF3298 domain-containing protein [Rikenellaceae bacterium]|nr:DUF3298 domain-containing protein [Rikenellaceae bacterium]